ncbi:hypothetical protein GCM10011321_25650 [Youhaiella tibetensis]|uniref:Uncharacterized protein n=1 Tax=Paradevosia tibetensis TaxID=1447062 RepID=A0A5B9DJE4_9HYPH|nr:hypothetical protein [Youhaiella tibetensis]QEE19421.1 hypothetical protein FNA67_04185 [Youhaiella tibetensis]GGF33363.1 hypothetical protein GCM10011321_25650 [Youhaiella tibetensis]
MENDIVILKSVGRYFSKQVPPVGVWLWSLMWHDDERGPMHLVRNDVSEMFEARGHNIGADIYAVLMGLREAESLGLAVEVHTANEPNAKTIPEWFDAWEKNGWKAKSGRTPENLDWWREIKEITTRIPVTWHKREKGPIDTVKEYELLLDMIEDRDNEFWMQRAFDRDPWK